MNQKKCDHWFGILVIMALSGCTSGVLSLSSEEQIDVSVVNLRDSKAAGRALGKTPMTLDLNEYLGQGLRFTKDGREPQLWIVVPDGASEIRAQVKLNEAGQTFETVGPKVEEKVKMSGATAQEVNQLMRLVMASYQALSQNKIQLARKVAQDAQKLNNEIAAPLILQALADIKEGQTKSALPKLQQARLLDESDTNINKLIKAIQ